MKVTKAERKFIKELWGEDSDKLTKRQLKVIRNSWGYHFFKLGKTAQDLKKAMILALPKGILNILQGNKK